MLDTQGFGNALKDKGYNFFSGVPCSFLKDLINYSINECEYVMAANEGEAVAVCAGAQVAGRKTVVLMQNSGLGNAVSPLTSLNAIFRIPTLGLVSLRGEPGLSDEPQHDLMGVVTGELLSAMRIDWEYLSANQDEAEQQLIKADGIVAEGKPFFFVVKKETFSKVALSAVKKELETESLPSRWSMLEAVTGAAGKNTVIAATTGFTGRELYQLGDEARNFYMVGSLGCLGAFCLGLSLAKPDRPIIALDGDGSLLMRTGSMAVTAAYKPRRFMHVLLDNAAHESTGGQFTVSGSVNWVELAKAVGYGKVLSVSTPAELAQAVLEWENAGGLVFVHARIKTGAPDNLGRPKTKPAEVAARLRVFLAKDQE